MFPHGVFLSELLGRPVLDDQNQRIGRVGDIGVALADPFPKASLLKIEIGGGKSALVEWDDILAFENGAFKLRSPRVTLGPAEPREGEVLLARDILDKQIVDTNGRKVVRVNDLKLADAVNGVRLVAADIGAPGLLRRLLGSKLAGALARLKGIRLEESLISWNSVELLETELAGAKLVVSHEKLFKLHPADMAEIIEDLHIKEQTAIFHALDSEKAAEMLQEVEPEVQTLILQNLAEEKAADILEEMDPDDAADLLGELHEEKAKDLLKRMDEEDAREVRELLGYDEDTAGGLMTTEFLAFRGSLTAEETINELRRLSPEAETIYYLYVVDEHGTLIGVLSLRDLIVAAPSTPISEIMITDVIKVDVDASPEEIAEIINKYDFLAVPVVNAQGRLVGIVTVDDVFDLVLTPPRRRRLRKKS
ncbi:MAG TPA: magnesium transporter [Firmicutes bacterium]|nr:magnesium transporter [Bacillota bacterium]